MWVIFLQFLRSLHYQDYTVVLPSLCHLLSSPTISIFDPWMGYYLRVQRILQGLRWSHFLSPQFTGVNNLSSHFVSILIVHPPHRVSVSCTWRRRLSGCAASTRPSHTSSSPSTSPTSGAVWVPSRR